MGELEKGRQVTCAPQGAWELGEKHSVPCTLVSTLYVGMPDFEFMLNGQAKRQQSYLI